MTGVIRLLVLVVPFAILAFWGESYLRDVFHILESPGVPIRLTYSSNGGPVVVTADSYSLDIRRGFLEVSRLKLSESSGRPIASADRVTATGIRVLQLGNQIVRVRALGVTGRVTRLATGTIDIERALPSRTGPVSRIPFEVVVERGNVQVVDLMGESAWRQPLSADRVRVAGVGDDWVASANVDAPGIGSFPLRLQHLSGAGLWLDIRARDASLAPALAHFLTVPPLKSPRLAGFTANSIQLTGHVALYIPERTGAKRYAAKFLADSGGEAVTVRSAGLKVGGTSIDACTFTGLATEAGIAGVADAKVGPNRVRFDGSADWKGAAHVAGKIEAEVAGSDSVPATFRRRIDPRVSFRRATFTGWIDVSEPSFVRADGEVQVARASYRDESASDVSAHVWLSPNLLAVHVSRSQYRGERVSGNFALDVPHRGLTGVLNARHFDLGYLGRRFGAVGLTGAGSGVVYLGGDVEHPRVAIDARGSAGFRREKIDLQGDFAVDASYEGDVLDIDRAVIQGPFGLLSASGSIANTGALQVQVTGRDLQPAAFDPRVTGQANLTGHVDGTIQAPLFHGYAEAYEVGVQKEVIPALSANFTADRRQLAVNDVHATQGTAQLTGAGYLRFVDQAISGHFSVQTLQVADFLGETTFGSIDVTDGSFGGSLARPLLSASIGGKNVFAQGIEFDNVTAKLTSDGYTARAEAIRATVPSTPPGAISGSAVYDIDRGQGSAKLAVTDLALGEVAPKVSIAVPIEGLAGGTADIRFNRQDWSAAARGDLRHVSVNGTSFGDGTWSAGFASGKIAGDLDLRSNENRFSFHDLTYDPATTVLSGHLDLSNARLADLIAIEEGYVADQPDSLVENLRDASGLVSVVASFSGTKGKLHIDVPTLQGKVLAFRGVDLGHLDASATLDGDRLTIPEFSVSGGVLNLTSSGYVDRRGETAISGRISKLLIADIGRIVPELAAQSGQATVLFDASGPTRNPEIQASVEAIGMLLKPGESPDRALRASLVIDADAALGKIGFTGDYYYRGFQGLLKDGTVAYEFPATIPQDGAIAATLTVANRPLSEIAPLVEGISPAASDGTLGGKISVAGTVEHPELKGAVTLQAAKMSFEVPRPAPKPTLSPLPNAPAPGAVAPEASRSTQPPPTKIETGLRNVLAKLELAANRIRLTLDAESSMGGHVSTDVSTNAAGLADTLRSQEVSGLLRGDIGGSVTLVKFSARQPFGGGTYVAAVADGKIGIGGTMSRPAFTGTINLTQLDSNIPTFPSSDGVPSTPSIDPSFDVQVQLAQQAHLRTTAADLSVFGGGSIGGTLSAPAIRGLLEVEKGTIRLPGSTLRLDQGGTLRPSYEPAVGGAIASVDVDMVGHTAITALRYGDIYQRYAISIDIKGDLLKEGGLILNATSDPGDLSQERILALLGETDLLQTLNTGANSDTDRRLRDALAGFALPALAEPITSRLAQGIGLEYLTVEYNTYEQASVGFAKSLTAGFSIQGRRQIGPPAPGFRAVYDLRLVYTPRQHRGFLNRFTLSFGADQDVSWKFDLEYGFRF